MLFSGTSAAPPRWAVTVTPVSRSASGGPLGAPAGAGPVATSSRETNGTTGAKCTFATMGPKLVATRTIRRSRHPPGWLSRVTRATPRTRSSAGERRIEGNHP
ncbi:hypothetical protein TPA0909_00820 [Streptomyces albus]|nr:hypothetical protein TPA0909_00820 [Streptomyces albus]